MKNMSKRLIQKENTRNKIIDTACRMFAEKGFAVATSDIAKEAGISHGSIFVHFPTVNDLLIAVLSEFGRNIGLQLHSLAEAESGMAELLAAHLGVLREYEGFYTRFISEINLLPEEAKNTFAVIQSAAAFHFSKVAGSEKARGNIKEIPTHMLFNTWIGLVHYYLQNKVYFAPEGSVIDRYKQELIDTYLRLIKNT